MIDNEFKLLKEYMDVYIQLLPYCDCCNGIRLKKPQLPTFEYFKETYSNPAYSLVIPAFKESKTVYDKNKIVAVHTHGLGSTNGIGYRYYNYWKGCKYFTGGNMKGDYTIEVKAMNEILKCLK